MKPKQKVGFFRRRDRTELDVAIVAAEPVMAIVTVVHPSIGRALRSGRWRKLGKAAIPSTLTQPAPSVQWPVGTTTVTVWNASSGGCYDSSVDDPTIQRFERAAAWDAEYHIPQRLSADYGAEHAAWHVGGPIWRERLVAEERARRFAGQPGNALPPGYVPVAG